MRDLKPLEHSHEYNQLEREYKRLAIDLFKKNLMNQASDLNVYGMPHLGSQTLLTQYLIHENINNISDINVNRENLRYLTQAWKFRNGKRGLFFLKTYLRCLWGNDFDVIQLWQKKNEPYPTALKSKEDIELSGESLNDYYLTSRLHIILYGNEYFSDSVAENLNKTLPARLFIHEVEKRTIVVFNLDYATSSHIYSIVQRKGVAKT